MFTRSFTLLSPARNLRRAQLRGIRAVKIKARKLTLEIIALLRDHDPNGRMTARQVAVLANRLGLRTGRGNLWDVDRIFLHLRRARRALQLERMGRLSRRRAPTPYVSAKNNETGD